MKDKNKLDKFHYHEVLDRLHVINTMIDEFLLEHPVVINNKKINKKIEKASELLSKTYQEIGGRF
jgi:hypothetical protein